MHNPNRSRLIAGALTLLASTALFLAVPGQPHAATSSCNGTNTGKVCWQNESCLNLLFYKQCTTTYKYYAAAGGTGGGSGLDDAALQPTGGCVWGRDYLGWAPRRCD
ncbi:MAG: hypothetical protein V3S91_08320 [Gemmatimonadota bacterium]|jgi:hypothetical protein|nr:hypothetical protein [Gemmatimonadota bacterium]